MNNQKYIRALFYVTPRFKWKYWVNWLISIRTLSWYSHCELWTPADTGFEHVFNVQYCNLGECSTHVQGTCYSSTMRGDDNGTRKADASLVLDHPEHWMYVEIPVTDEQYELLMCIMNIAVDTNAGYATWDIMKFLSPVHFSDNKRYICSEFSNDMLVWIGILEGFGIISPKALIKKLLKCGYEVKSLKE